MDLFDRYLEAVRRLLPKAQQDDIVRELSDDLRSQVEEREAAVGRTLHLEEQEEILRQWGHPWLLASKYQPQRHLIGPCVYPIYAMVLKLSLGVALAVHAIAAAVLLANGRAPADVISVLARVPFGPLMTVFAWVTVVFAVIERNLPRVPQIANWSPRSLPDVQPPGTTTQTGRIVGQIAGETIFMLWWAALPHRPWLIFGPADAFLDLSPAWLSFHAPILAVSAALLVILWVQLVRPDWGTGCAVARLAVSLASLVLFALMLAAGPLIVAGDGGLDRAAAVADRIATVVLVVAALATAAAAVREALRLAGRERAPAGWSPRRR